MNEIIAPAIPSLLLAATLSGQLAATETHTLTFNTWVGDLCGPEGIFALMTEASDGKLQFESTERPARPGDMYRQVMELEADIVWGSAPFTPELPLTNLASLPFVSDDSARLSVALHELAAEHLAAEFEGLRVLALHTNDFYQFHLTSPAESLEELEGLSIRAPGPTMAASVVATGAKAVIMSPFTALEKIPAGELDGIAGDWSMLLGLGFMDITPHHLELDLMTTPFYLAMSESAYSALPDDLKAVVDNHTTSENARRLNSCFRDPHRDDIIKQAKAAGHTVARLSDEDQATLRAAANEVVEAKLAEMDADGPEARAFYQALIAHIEEID